MTRLLVFLVAGLTTHLSLAYSVVCKPSSYHVLVDDPTRQCPDRADPAPCTHALHVVVDSMVNRGSYYERVDQYGRIVIYKDSYKFVFTLPGQQFEEKGTCKIDPQSSSQ